MQTCTINLKNLSKIIPVQTKDFLDVCNRHKVKLEDAVKALNQDDYGELEIDDAESAYGHIRTAFDRLNVAFKATTTEGQTFLELEPQYNDDEMDGVGAYFRIKYAIVLSPAARKIRKHFKIADITVYNPREVWDQEKAVTGV